MPLKTFELGLEPHAFNSTTQEGEVEDVCELEFSLVYIEFQNSQGYIERLGLKHIHRKKKNPNQKNVR